MGEYDTRGFNPPESVQHAEYAVTNILKHPSFDPVRLHHNLAILTLATPVDLSLPTVNTACLPACDEQFDFRFNNGSGARCWAAGWGKRSVNDTYRLRQHKLDLPLVDTASCNTRLKRALNDLESGEGDIFAVDESEICAGGEPGKDTCKGDGGAPVVCEALSGRWTAVGLVSWGISCDTGLPAVYTRISYFRDWINKN